MSQQQQSEEYNFLAKITRKAVKSLAPTLQTFFCKHFNKIIIYLYFKQLITEHSTIFSPIFCSIVMSSVLDFYYIFSFLDFVRVAKLKLNNFIFLNFLCLYIASGKWGSINIGKLITGRNALHSQQLSCTLLSNKMYRKLNSII